MYEGITSLIMNEGYRLVLSAIALLIIYFGYRAILQFLKRKGEGLGFEPHIINTLRLIIRVIALIIASISLFTIFDIPSELFVGTTALLGAALGFGSSQTINNIVAGFYVLISQPFKVEDYIKLGDLEGQVEEISINYTTLYTPTLNIIKIPNTQVLNSKILNMTHEGVIKYTFKVGFGHDYSEEDVRRKIIEPSIREFCKTYCDIELRTPEAYLDTINRLEKSYMFRLFIPEGEAKLLHTLQPELLQIIMKYFDKLKNG
jgi:small-conductance mechanosensitive channel